MLPNEEFALNCRAYYGEIGLVVDAANGEFAHCPYPEDMGDRGYYLLHDHHQHQGILQSKDVDKLCFFIGHARQWLLNCDPFPDNYFELWDIYEKYSKEHNKKFGGDALSDYVKRNPQHQSWAGSQSNKNLTLEQIKERGRKAYAAQPEEAKIRARLNGAPLGGQKTKLLGIGIFDPVRKKELDGVRRMNNTVLFKCTVTGKISTAPALAKYQKNRGIDTTCRERLPEDQQPYNKSNTG
jgi:hypothetical protein